MTDTNKIKESGKSTGERIGAVPYLIVAYLVGVVGGIAGYILGKMPKRVGVYQKMVKLGYKGLYKKTSAHVVCNTIYGDGEVVPRPATMDSEKGRLETNNDEWWTATNGLQPTRIGDTPVVTGIVDQHELVDHIAARTAEAVDLGKKRYQEVSETDLGTYPVSTQGAGQQARADGSGTAIPEMSTFDDIWLDVSNPEPNNDGWIVSMKKAYDLHWDQAATEEMQNQETRGILAAKDPKRDKKRMLLMAAMILGAFCLGLFGPALAAQLGGSAGGAAPGGGVSMFLGWF